MAATATPLPRRSVPATRLEAPRDDGSLLLWARRGATTVEMDGVRAVMTPGTARWLPTGTLRRIRCAPGAVAVPIGVPPSVAVRPLPTAAFPVTGAHTDWLLHHFARSLDFLRGAATGWHELASFVEASCSPESLCGHLPVPPLPRSAAALQVARRLLRTPALENGLDTWASLTSTGARTLRRQFANETGLPFERWRTALRLARAREQLAAGREVTWTAHQVGYRSAGGLIRAFQRGIGMSPTEHRERCGPGGRPVRPGPSPIEAATTVPRVNPFHVAVWTARGTAVVDLAGATVELPAGQAIWLPAGVRQHITTRPGGVILPLTWRPGGQPINAGGPVPVHQVPEDLLLLAALTSHTALTVTGRSSIPDPVETLLDAGKTAAAPTTCTPAAAAAARRMADLVAGDLADPLQFAGWARRLAVEEEQLRAAFIAVTGSSPGTWRHRMRMHDARRLLATGAPPGTVAKRLGYGHVSGFSKAFRAAHGVSPREYQQQELAWHSATPS